MEAAPRTGAQNLILEQKEALGRGGVITMGAWRVLDGVIEV